MDIMKKIIVIINRIKISEGLLINDIISVLREIVFINWCITIEYV